MGMTKVCARACVCVCAFACACACVCVCVQICACKQVVVGLDNSPLFLILYIINYIIIYIIMYIQVVVGPGPPRRLPALPDYICNHYIIIYIVIYINRWVSARALLDDSPLFLIIYVIIT